MGIQCKTQLNYLQVYTTHGNEKMVLFQSVLQRLPFLKKKSAENYHYINSIKFYVVAQSV